MYTIQADTVLITRTLVTTTQTATITEYYCPLHKTEDGIDYIFDLALGDYVEVAP